MEFVTKFLSEILVIDMFSRNAHYISLNTREKLISEESHGMCSQSKGNIAEFNYQTYNHGNILS